MPSLSRARHALPALAVLAASALHPLVARAQNNTGYTVTKHYPVGGEGGWDYLAFDTSGHRLFVTHGTHVVVLDAETGKTLGDIPNTPHVHGVAFAFDLGRGFITAAGDTAVHIFDLKTLKPLGTVHVDPDDDAIVYDRGTHQVVSLNGDANSASVIDGASGKLVGTIKLPGGPEFAASDMNGTVYVNIEDKSMIVALDLRGMKVAKQWSLAPCANPTGLAIDREHHRLFSGCHSKVMAISDYDAGKVVTTLPIGAGVDATRFDAGTQLAFASNRDGTLTVIHEDSPDKFTELGNVHTAPEARTMALDPRSHTIYLATAKFEPAQGNARPKMIPGTFEVLVVEKK